MRVATSLILTILVPTGLAGQPPQAPATERPRFDITSVKPNRSPDPGINNRFSPGRFSYVNTPLWVLIQIAYGMPGERIIDMPQWARAEKFDITGTYDPARVEGRTGRERDTYQQAMFQQLLEDRFALRVRRETREMPVYELVKSRADGELGPRLRASTIKCPPLGTADPAQCGTRITSSMVRGQATDWRMVVAQLSSQVARTVIDKTGLAGQFDVTLEWTPDPALMQSPEAVASATAATAAAPGDRTNIFTALQEQLGVRLQAARAPLEVLVIERLERPTPD